jgi:hypothetical protein
VLLGARLVWMSGARDYGPFAFVTPLGWVFVAAGAASWAFLMTLAIICEKLISIDNHLQRRRSPRSPWRLPVWLHGRIGLSFNNPS